MRTIDEAAADEGFADRTAKSYRMRRAPRHHRSRGHGRLIKAQLTDIGARMKNKRMEIPKAPKLPDFLEKILASRSTPNPGR